jgi:hypothetical protein
MPITSDVKSGQCKICLQGVSGGIPVVELEHTAGMRVWGMTVCKKCAAELRQHLDEFLTPQNS